MGRGGRDRAEAGWLAEGAGLRRTPRDGAALCTAEPGVAEAEVRSAEAKVAESIGAGAEKPLPICDVKH